MRYVPLNLFVVRTTTMNTNDTTVQHNGLNVMIMFSRVGYVMVIDPKRKQSLQFCESQLD